jgi:HD-GYP domain-containing protein (c-di-GMP phosphodiesterase class II)
MGTLAGDANVEGFLELLGQGVDDLAGHGFRVGAVALALGTNLGLQGQRLEHLEVAAMLHDVGKVRLDPEVIGKPGPLSPDEWRQVRRHPELGFAMTSGVFHAEIADTILSHHERWDGRGYPQGRSGREIPLLARILCVADTFDAMTSDRCYRASLPVEVVMAELIAHAGTQFDPAVVEAMENLIVTGALFQYSVLST